MSLKTPLGVVILSALAMAACSNSAKASTPVSNTPPPKYADMVNPLGLEAVAGGAELFKVNCSSCHGSSGHGDGPAAASLTPRPRNLAEFQKTASDGYLFWRINVGRPGTPMVAWKGVLKEEQIWAIITYLRTLK